MENSENKKPPLPNMTLNLLIQDHKRDLLINDQLMASLERKVSGPTIETDIVDSQLEGVEFDCACGYEEGRSEADKRYHEVNCK